MSLAEAFPLVSLAEAFPLVSLAEAFPLVPPAEAFPFGPPAESFPLVLPAQLFPPVLPAEAFPFVLIALGACVAAVAGLVCGGFTPLGWRAVAVGFIYGGLEAFRRGWETLLVDEDLAAFFTGWVLDFLV